MPGNTTIAAFSNPRGGGLRRRLATPATNSHDVSRRHLSQASVEQMGIIVLALSSTSPGRMLSNRDRKVQRYPRHRLRLRVRPRGECLLCPGSKLLGNGDPMWVALLLCLDELGSELGDLVRLALPNRGSFNVAARPQI